MKACFVLACLSFLPAGISVAHTHAHHGEHDSSKSEETHDVSARVIPLDKVKVFKNNGNSLQGLATRSQGAKEHEVWMTSIQPGSKTPPHVHSGEETFVVLKGEGLAVIDGKKIPFKAPCTVIAPAGVPHQLINTGKIPTQAVVVVGIDSEIKDAKNQVMNLPWRM